MLKRLIDEALPHKEVSEQVAQENSFRRANMWTRPVWCSPTRLSAWFAAEIAPMLEAAAKANPNVRFAGHAVKLELSPKERTDGD